VRPTAVNADAGRARVHLAFRRDLPFSYESWSRVRLSDVEKWTFLGRAAVIPTAPVLCGRVAIGGQVTSIIGRNDAKVSVRPPARVAYRRLINGCFLHAAGTLAVDPG